MMTEKEEACLIVAKDAVAAVKQKDGRSPSSWIVKLQSGKIIRVDTDEVIRYLLDKILEKSIKEME